jgi:F-type H+-transporting ATPase subunit epsilon
VLADLAETVQDIDREMITAHISEMEREVAKMEQGNALDKLIARLDHFKEIDRHLTGTAMH